MLITEFDQSDLTTALYDPERDKLAAHLPTDTRKKSLTLRHLNRLKKLRALQRLEDMKRQDLLGLIYAAPDEGGGGGGGPGMF